MSLEERGSSFVEGIVVAIDVSQVAGGAHDIMPGATFTGQQAGDVREGAPQLGMEVANVNALSVLVDGGGSGDQQNRQAVEVDPHASRKGTRLGVMICLIEHTMIGDGPLFDGCMPDSFQNVSKFIHWDASFSLPDLL